MALGRTKEAIIPLANSVKALSASQQALVLSNNGVSESMIREILKTNEVSEADINAIMVKRALSNSYKKLTKAQLSEIITAQTGDAAKTKAILTELGLVDAKDTDTISTQNLSRANVEATLAQQGLTTAQTEAITVQMGLATKVGKTTNIFEGMLISAGDLLSQAWQFIKIHPALVAAAATVAIGVGVISSQIKEAEQATQDAINSGEELKDYIDNVSQYISQIEELRETLDSTDSSYEDQKQAREELLRIQDEMVQKYGDEIKKLDLMKSSVEDLSDAIFNSTTKSEADRWLVDNAAAINQAEQTVDTFGITFVDDLQEGITRIQEIATKSVSDFNYEIDKIAQLTGLEDASKYYAKSRKDIVKKQDELLKYLQDAYNQVTGKNGGMKYVPEWAEKGANWLGDKMFGEGNTIGQVDEDIELFKKSGYYKLISQMPDVYKQLTSAVNDYNNAVASGDTTKQQELFNSMVDIYNAYGTGNSSTSWYIRDVLNPYLDAFDKSDEELRERAIKRAKDIQQAIAKNSIQGINYDNLIKDLSDQEFDVLLDILNGKLGDIDWLKSLTPDKIKKKIDAVINSSAFSWDQFFSERTVDGTDSTLKDIVDDQISPLKEAYQKLIKGEALDDDFFNQFPELLKYASDTDELINHMQGTINSLTESSLKELLLMYNSTDDENIKAILSQAIELVRIDRDITQQTKKTNDAYAEQKQLIKENIHVLNDQIKKEEERKERLQDQKEELEGQKEALEKQKKAVEKSYQVQIDALDDEIERLRDEADEQERVNDLKEKELALEKAKQTQVRRYSSARGWTVEVSTEAVNQAKKEYDDAVRESQIDELEKQKKELERQKETASESYESQIENIEDQINALEDQIDVVDAEIEKYKSLKDEQNSYLSFYKTYSADFATATGKQAEALGKLNQALEKYRELSDLPEIQQFYEEAIKQYSDAYDGYSQGGVVTYNGLAQLHGANGAELVLNNNDVGKIYQMIHGSTAAQLVNTMAQNSIKKATSATGNLNSPGQHGNNSYTWQLSGNNIIVDSYEKFKGYMDRYVREAKQDLVVGR